MHKSVCMPDSTCMPSSYILYTVLYTIHVLYIYYNITYIRTYICYIGNLLGGAFLIGCGLAGIPKTLRKTLEKY